VSELIVVDFVNRDRLMEIELQYF